MQRTDAVETNVLVDRTVSVIGTTKKLSRSVSINQTSLPVSKHPVFCPSVCVSVCLLCFYLSICVSVCLSVSLLSVSLSACVFVYLCFCLLCLSVCLSVRFEDAKIAVLSF